MRHYVFVSSRSIGCGRVARCFLVVVLGGEGGALLVGVLALILRTGRRLVAFSEGAPNIQSVLHEI